MTIAIAAQTVLVTGAGRGLGAAIVRAFAREGAQVAVNYRNSRSMAEALTAELGERVHAFRADVRDGDAVARLIDEVGEHFGSAPTTVVHNALADFKFNGDARARLDALTWDEFTAQFGTSVRGALNLIQAVQPAMASAHFGRIVTIGTNLFHNPVVPYHDYTAAKAALLSLTRTAAKDLGQFGITVNMVSGGLLRVTDASSATPDAVFDIIAANTPLGEVTTPDQAADAVLFFASPWSRAVTGQNLIVDGGLVFN